MDRRKALVQLGSLLLMVPAARILSGCGGPPGSSGGTPGEENAGGLSGADAGDSRQTLEFTSQVANAHTHTFGLPTELLETPPIAGVTRPTSVILGHSHTLTLTQQELEELASGSPLQLETSLDAGHTHTFVLQRP